MGGKVDGRASSSTDTGLRTGLGVHNVQSSVGPISRSASDSTTISTRRARSALPQYVRDTIVVQQLCTLDICCDGYVSVGVC